MKPPVLKCTAPQHGSAINELAERGVIAPIAFTAPDGIRRVANSAWAAYDWLHTAGHPWLDASGHYAPGNKPIVYHWEGKP
jgi:hypothetical protein